MELQIKELLKAKGITQKELAEKLNMNATALSRIINGNPTLETLKKIAKVLEVDIENLFTKLIKENDLFILKNGKYINIGKININKLENKNTGIKK